MTSPIPHYETRKAAKEKFGAETYILHTLTSETYLPLTLLAQAKENIAGQTVKLSAGLEFKL